MKKFLTFILAITMGVTTLSAVACKQEENSPISTPIVERLEMEKNNLLLTLGDKVELAVAYNEIENGVLTWTSSAPNVVSVDANGCAEALREGSATVTAHYGSKQASCKIEVALSGNVPTFVFDDDVSEQLTLVKGETFALGARVRFNGKIFDDAEIEYFVADESVGSMIGGAFVSKNVTGSAKIDVFGVWRGLTVASKSITINVIAENSVLLNGGRLKNVNLYTAASHEGKDYPISQTVSDVYISEDGTQIKDYELFVLDEGIAKIEENDGEWTITALKSGKTNLIVSYLGKEFPFAITVQRPVFEVAKRVEYSVFDGKYFDADSNALKDVSEMFDGFGALVSYELDGKEYKAKDGKLNLSEREAQSVTLYNETVGYKVNFDAYTMLIDELKDFEMIYAGDTTADVTGSFVLVKDIIEPNTVLKMPEGKVPNNFAGTFDGRGHVLSFTFEHGTTYRFGLFGEYLKGAKIKNVALYNVTQDGTTGKNTAGIICSQGAQNAVSDPESIIENVFVDVKFSTARDANFAFMGNAMWKLIIRNVIIHVPEVPTGTDYGSFARGACATGGVSNSYVVSKTPLYPSTFNPVPTLYADYEAMQSAGNDYSSFDNGYWDIAAYGVPVWKKLVENFNN